MKVQYVLSALAAGKNKFTVDQLTAIIRADAGDKALARRTRRALFVARKAGIVLEPLRDGGKAVTAYQLQGPLPEIAATPVRKAAKRAASPKAAAKAKVTKGSLESAVRKINASSKVKKQLATAKTDEDIAAIKAKNLATIKAVGKKVKQEVHPITGRELSDEQADVLNEFRALESAWESEEQDRAFARAAVRENLKKESYVE